MPRISPLKVALGVGAAGAMVDVTSSVRFVEGLDFSEGQTNQFQDAAAGAVTFVIENYTGQYTPNNPSSTLLAPMAEGTIVTTQVGSLVRDFSIVSFGFPTSQTDDGLLTLICDDMLGDASRVDLDLLTPAMVMATSPYLFWALNDPAGSQSAADTAAALHPLQFASSGGTIVFGTPDFPTGEPAVTLTGSNTASAELLANMNVTPSYPSGSRGLVSFWVDQSLFTGSFGWAAVVAWGAGASIQFGPTGVVYAATGLSPISLSYTASAATFFSASITYTGSGPYTVTVTLYANGIQVATGSGSTATLPASVVTQASLSNVFNITPVTFAHFSHTPTAVHEELTGITNEAGRLQAIAAAVPEITLGALPSDLSTAPIGVANVSGGSAFDAINMIVRTEQGYVYTATSGTLLAPSQTIQFRARNRPATPAYTFDAVTEIGDYLPFVRDITYLAKTTTATGPDTSATFTDSTLSQRAGSKNASETVALENYSDLYTWASDRSNRAKNAVINATSVTIDALTTPTDRSADLLAMRRGDRIRISDIPSASLGFTTWDGWLIGKTESHTLTSHTFTLYLAACTPATAVWQNNTISGEGNRWMAGGVLSLSSALTSGATTASVATSDPLTKFTTTAGNFPVDILIDSERVTVTNCTAATPQVMTITRGVGGTTAAAHSAGALVDLFTPALWAY